MTRTLSFAAAALVATSALAAELPDPALSPGVVASTDQAEVCGYVGNLSYSKRHRATTAEMKAEVRRRYGEASCGEIDHRVPLALGGADVIENLWCQSGPPAVWHYRLKDELELRVWQMVCRERSMPLDVAQAMFLARDWAAGYCQIIGGAPCSPLMMR